MGNLINPHITRLGQTYFSDTRWMSLINRNYSFLLSNDFFLHSYVEWFFKEFYYLDFFFGTTEQNISHYQIIRHSNGITIILFIRLINYTDKSSNFVRSFLDQTLQYFFNLRTKLKIQKTLKKYYKDEIVIFSNYRSPYFKITEVYNPYKNPIYKKYIKKLYQLPFWNERDFSEIHNQYLDNSFRKESIIQPFHFNLWTNNEKNKLLLKLYAKYGLKFNTTNVIKVVKKKKILKKRYNPLIIFRNIYNIKSNFMYWRTTIIHALFYILYLKLIKSQISFGVALTYSCIYNIKYNIDLIYFFYLNLFKKLKLYLNLFISNRYNNLALINHYNLLWFNYNNFFNYYSSINFRYWNNQKYINRFFNKKFRKKLLKINSNGKINSSKNLFKNNYLLNSYSVNHKKFIYSLNFYNFFSDNYKNLFKNKINLQWNNYVFDEGIDNKLIENTNMVSPYNTIYNSYQLILYLRYINIDQLDIKKYILNNYISKFFKNKNQDTSLNIILNNILINNKVINNTNKFQFVSEFLKIFKNIQRRLALYNRVEVFMWKAIRIWKSAFFDGLYKAYTNKFISTKINLMLIKLSPQYLTAPLVNDYIINNLLIGHSLNRIIYPLINQGYKPYKHNIFWGIKIGCFGRFWRRGRARQVWFNEGSTPLSTITAWVDYKYNFVKLRNGTCSIKVFITYRKNFNYSI